MNAGEKNMSLPFIGGEPATREAMPKSGKPRVREPERGQAEIQFLVPDDALSSDHPARLIWNVLGALPLANFYVGIESVVGGAGRPPLCPQMLLTLWLYAISEGICSAKEISRLTKSDLAFRWIVGNLEVSHDVLSGFLAKRSQEIDGLMTDVLASLMEKGLLTLKLTAQDGTRTRAAATAPSFRTYGSLLECRRQAALHLKAVLAAADDPEYTRAQHQARERAARDFQSRVEAAIATVQELQRTPSHKNKWARASTTDAEARTMKMGDGGYRPAYNVQYAVAGEPEGGARTIVAVRVTNVGSDLGSLAPVAEQIKERTGRYPEALLADGGHVKHEDIIDVEKKGIAVIAPPAENAKTVEDLHAEGADEHLIAWRERMDTEEAKQMYRARAGLAELANAHQKEHHDLKQFLVRGLKKVTTVAIAGALAFNILQHGARLLP
jgi:transposase